MNLRDRLALLQQQAGGRPRTSAPQPSSVPTGTLGVERIRERLSRLSTARTQGITTRRGHQVTAAELAVRLGGEPVGEGLIRIQRELALTGTHGSVPLARLKCPTALPGSPPIDPAHCLYLDTETTGLSGGSGTIAFLIGTARVLDDRLHITQWLITRFAAEPTLLGQIIVTLRPTDRLVSYNGKSFDAPLLSTRLRMHGLHDPLSGLAHLDLLHPTRRLFSGSWPDCRLATLEARLLNYRRSDDLPGAEAPQAWFDWLHRGEASRLVRVADHNCRDLVSLAVAHTALAEACESPKRGDIDLHALAQWICSTNPERARALLIEESERLDPRGLGLLARLHRRAGNWRAAVELWQRLAEAGSQEALEQLAKYHEHHRKDYHTALTLGRRLDHSPKVARRVDRLRAKLAAMPP